jgi:hypothetical protein
MYIFHKFPSVLKAQEFAVRMRIRYEMKAKVYSSQDESDKVDPFPYVLTPPIVLVSRKKRMELDELSNIAVLFNGEFAGT